MYCSKCGNDTGDEPFCNKCGNKVDGTGGSPQSQNVVYVREKSEGLAAVLSVLWPGLGQIYVGMIGRGLLIMLAGIMIAFMSFLIVFSIFLVFVPMILGAVFWIWNIFDAYKLAQEYNRVLKSTGNRPW